MRLVCSIAVALLVLPPSEATAQRIPELAPGERVRIRTVDSERLVGRVERLRNDILLLSPDSRSGQQAIPLRSITRFDVRRRASPTQGAWRWAKRGFVVGAAAGAVACGIDVESCRETPAMSEAEIILASALFVGGGMAFLGAVGGALFPGGCWERVPVPEYAYFGPLHEGGVLFVLSWGL